jgi:hypothetical protein
MPLGTFKKFTFFYFSEVPREERILRFWYYLSVLSCVRLWFSHFLFCDAIWVSHTGSGCKSGSHKHSILQMSLSWVAVWIMAEFYWESVQYSSSVLLSLKIDYLMYWSEMLWHWKKISPSCCHIVPTFRVMQLILVYWSQNLWIVLPGVPCTQYVNEIHRGPVSLSWTKMGPFNKINVMTWLRYMDYSPVHSNI